MVADVRSRLPLLERGASFNHAGVAPQPMSDAARRFHRARSEKIADEFFLTVADVPRRIRSAYASLLKVSDDEIAITHNTAEGINIIAQGLDWREGDRILTVNVEYPSNVYPWWNLRDRGVEIVTVDERGGRVDLNEFIEAIDERVRLVAISHVEFASGYAFDLDKLAGACRERDVLLCVDLAQSLGALPIDLSKVDAAAWPTWKWLMGPVGMGGFYLSKQWLDRVRPVFVGSDGMKSGRNYLDYRFEFEEGAKRFEYSTGNVVGMIEVAEAVERAAAAFAATDARPTERIFANADVIIEGLKQRGFALYSSTAPGERSGILSFTAGEHDLNRVSKLLKGKGFDQAVRGERLRLAPHYYNDAHDIERLLAAIDHILAG